MAIFSIFKTPKHQKYKYIPRFYDPDKEDLERRLEKAKKMRTDDLEGMKIRISSGLRRGNVKDGTIRKKYIMRSNMFLLAILFILMILTYFFIVNYLPRIIQAIE